MQLRDLSMAVLTGLLVTMFTLSLVGLSLTGLPGPDGALSVVFYVALFVLVTAVVYRKRRRPDRETFRHSIWDAIPYWQYTGRHVESGGITRDGQERALQKIQEQAEAEEENRS